MITIDGINLRRDDVVATVTINGAWVDARFTQILGGTGVTSRSIRNPHTGPWYDDKHAKLMRCVTALENALSDLIAETESAKTG